MKKIKEWWNSNRVLFVLGTIVIVCLLLILIVSIRYFYGGSKSSYGNRLDNIQSTPYKDEDKEILINKIKENTAVSEVEVHTQGKIIYIYIKFNNITLDKSKEVASGSLASISEDYQKLYDIHFTLVSEAKENQIGFTTMGAKNIGRTTILWNNNTVTEG